MENASKALIMAGGILISLLVIGALILTFNQLSYYQKSESTSEKTSQLADFNKEYVQYTYDDIKGYELISLINKVIDFNQKDGVGNSVDYDSKITIKVNNIDGFKTKYAVEKSSSLFTKNSYTIASGNTEFSDIINKFRTMETTYTLASMNKLSANYDTLEATKNQDEYEAKMKEIVGKVVKSSSGTITLKEIEQYRQYSEFKTSTFTPSEPKYYGNGQIKEMSFEFVK